MYFDADGDESKCLTDAFSHFKELTKDNQSAAILTLAYELGTLRFVVGQCGEAFREAFSKLEISEAIREGLFGQFCDEKSTILGLKEKS